MGVQVIRVEGIVVQAVNLGPRGWRVLKAPPALKGGIFRTQAELVAAIKRIAATPRSAAAKENRATQAAATIPPPPAYVPRNRKEEE